LSHHQRLYLLNKLKHAGSDEQGLATVFQAIVVLFFGALLGKCIADPATSM